MSPGSEGACGKDTCWSKTRRIVCASSRPCQGFVTKALMPAVWARAASIVELNPVHRMTGRVGWSCRSARMSASPVSRGIVTSSKMIFWSGRSQAVRLPKEFRFPGEEVRIRRHGSAVILEPVAEDWAWLDSIVGKLDEDFARAVDEQPKEQERPALKKLF